MNEISPEFKRGSTSDNVHSVSDVFRNPLQKKTAIATHLNRSLALNLNNNTFIFSIVRLVATATFSHTKHGVCVCVCVCVLFSQRGLACVFHM